MASIIIDGYNLTGIYHKNLEAQRKKLVERLVDYKKVKGHAITVVFDGWKNGSGNETRSETGGIKIIYSGLGEKADAVIKKIISSEKRHWIVVTSDREIADHAWSHESVVISSDEFQSVLERQNMDEGGGYDLLEDEESESPKKGSRRTLSRKEKAKRRAMEKL